jgi:hypothetical protein
MIKLDRAPFFSLLPSSLHLNFTNSSIMPSIPAPNLALETITQRILVLREQKVLLDADLAALYGVDTK